MQEVINVRGHHYILATSSLADDQDRALKHNDTFAVFNRSGDIRPIGLGEEGVYYGNTRFLSRLELCLGEKQRPFLLSSSLKLNNTSLSVDMTNPDSFEDGNLVVPRGTLHIHRQKIVWQKIFYERITFWNLGTEKLNIAFTIHWAADFKDIFEIRGENRPKRGQDLEASVDKRQTVLAYRGVDDVIRRSHINFSPTPESINSHQARFELSLQSRQTESFYLDATYTEGKDEASQRLHFDEALDEVETNFKSYQEAECSISSSNEQFNSWTERSFADLRMMISETEHGLYPYAGIPWFNTPFGRDGIITALETLWINPDIARGVLTYLAKTQATEENILCESEPGKILHETRLGEMAALEEVPFEKYYGTVDATPLFIILAGRYFERTGDRDFLEYIWPHVSAALDWIDNYGDKDEDGFVEYYKHSITGLRNQGWKDSDDCIFHADGKLAEGPIALCEVQGYVYDAKIEAARLALVLGDSARSKELENEAAALKDRFEQAFWIPEMASYALALDGQKHACKVRASNMGHALFSGIASDRHAQKVKDMLFSDDFYSGWGVRTIADNEPRFNPMAYHNGTIWPHDNAMIGAGLARYGFKKEVLGILSALFQVSLFSEFHRLAELWCGFKRQAEIGPTGYPVACSPQAWASGAVFMLLQSAVGLKIYGAEKKLVFEDPVLPGFLKKVHVKNLQVGDSIIDISFYRHDHNVGIDVQRVRGDVDVVIRQSF